jgi:hypothetical protein
MDHINRFRRTNHPGDADGFKHAPLPPLTHADNLKVVYVFGDPVDAVLSLFRRKYHFEHYLSMRKWDGIQKPAIHTETTIEEFSKRGRDEFRLARHLIRYRSEALPFQDILFLRYEAIFENVSKLRDFLELPKAFQEEFPKKVARQSSRASLAHGVKEQLEYMYRSLIQDVSSMKDVEIHVARRLNAGAILASSNYRTALRAELYDRLRGYLSRRYKLLQRK